MNSIARITSSPESIESIAVKACHQKQQVESMGRWCHRYLGIGGRGRERDAGGNQVAVLFWRRNDDTALQTDGYSVGSVAGAQLVLIDADLPKRQYDCP